MADGSPRPLRLAVLGSPIAHSRSPELHRAAYRVLGLDWEYEAIEVTSETLGDLIRSRDPSWRGLSLTMPLKQTVLPMLAEMDEVAVRTGAANTVLFDWPEPAGPPPGEPRDPGPGGLAGSASGERPGSEPDERRGPETPRVANPGPDVPVEREPVLRGFNTDVAGIVRALGEAGLGRARYVHVLGGGATAASAVAAAAELGAESVLVSVRSVERSRWLEPLAQGLGLSIRFRPLGIADRTVEVPDLVVSTLPGGAEPGVLFTDSTRRRALLFDVAYDPWPSALARAWGEAGGRVVSGLSMLLHQALLQVRVFTAGDPFAVLPEEDRVLEAMREAVGLEPGGRPAMPES